MRYGGDILNVFGDFPTLTDPRHADAYSPLWDAQLGLWTPKAVKAGLNKRQINENEVLNLAYSHPDLLTGVNPATGQPQLYGSVGVYINCAVIGYTATAPKTTLAPPTSRAPSSRPGNRQGAAGTLRPAGRTGGTPPEAPGGLAIAGPPAMRRPSFGLVVRRSRSLTVGLQGVLSETVRGQALTESLGFAQLRRPGTRT